MTPTPTRAPAPAPAPAPTLAAPPRRGGWIHYAACLDRDPELFFSERKKERAKAKAICAACPARVACLDDVIAVEDDAAASHRYGIVAGYSPGDRRDIYERRMDAAGIPAGPRSHARSPAPCGTKAARQRHRRRGETCAICHPAPEPYARW